MERIADSTFVAYFSGYSPHMLEYRGAVYPTVEHAYHCQRYADPAVVEAIASARSPYLAWQESQKHKAHQSPDFNERKAAVMEELCRAKLEQHEDVLRELVASGEAPIIKRWSSGPPPDGFWDDGVDGTGRNTMGKIWMKLRSELR